MKPLILGLGNDLLSDDGIGCLAAEKLAQELGQRVQVRQTSASGIALLDILTGYDKAIIIDAVQTGRVPPGTIIEIEPHDLRAIPTPSPHYTGLPEMMTLARELHLTFPNDVRILAVEAEDLRTIGAPPCAQVAAAIDKLVQIVSAYLKRWEEHERERPLPAGSTQPVG